MLRLLPQCLQFYLANNLNYPKSKEIANLMIGMVCFVRNEMLGVKTVDCLISLLKLTGAKYFINVEFGVEKIQSEFQN